MDAMSNGSLTRWGDVTSNPGNKAAWESFYNAYWSQVFAWAMARTRREEAAEDVALEVFSRLFRRITNPGLPPVEPDSHGSFKPYIFQVVSHLCMDYSRTKARSHAIGLTDAMIAGLEDPASVQDLCDRLAERESLEIEMGRYLGLYRSAIRGLKAAPQFDPTTFRVFLRVYHDDRRPSDVDVEFGYPRPGTASKYSIRVRDRLLALFRAGAAEGDAQGDGPVDLATILDQMVMLHGDPPD